MDCIFDASPRKALSLTMVGSYRFLFPFSVRHANAWRAWDVNPARAVASGPKPSQFGAKVPLCEISALEQRFEN
jgi:hypothetical protein